MFQLHTPRLLLRDFEMLGAQLVFGECSASNRGSARAMEKAGLIRTDRWHEQDAETGISEEHLRYTIALADWTKHRLVS